MSERVSAARSSVVMASGTLVSRATGFLAGVSVAAVLGQGTALANSYQTANELPNMLFELLIGGVITAALIPLLVTMREENDVQGQNAIGTVLIGAAALLTCIGLALAPVLAHLQTVRRPSLEGTTTLLLRWLLIEILGYGIMMFAGAVLQARGKFGVYAFAPALNNIAVIVTMVAVRNELTESLLAHPRSSAGVRWLAIGTASGVLIVALVMLSAAMRCGFRFTRSVRHHSLGTLARVSGWTTGYVVANLLAAFIVTALAFGTTGGSSAYLNAFRLFQLPHGVIAVSIMTVLTPALVRVKHDAPLLASRTTEGLRMLLTCMVGASALLATLATPIAALFHQGQFDSHDVAVLASALRLFAIGLTGFSAYLFMLRAYYARGNARTPFFVNLAENAINVVLAFALVDHLGVSGLIIAYSAAYLAAACFTYVLLRGDLGVGTVAPTLARSTLSAAPVLALGLVLPSATSSSAIVRILNVTAWAAAAGLVYVAMLALLRAPELKLVLLLRRNQADRAK